MEVKNFILMYFKRKMVSLKQKAISPGSFSFLRHGVGTVKDFSLYGNNFIMSIRKISI